MKNPDTRPENLRELLDEHLPQDVLGKLVEEEKRVEAWTVNREGKEAQLDYLCSKDRSLGSLMVMLGRLIDRAEGR